MLCNRYNKWQCPMNVSAKCSSVADDKGDCDIKIKCCICVYTKAVYHFSTSGQFEGYIYLGADTLTTCK